MHNYLKRTLQACLLAACLLSPALADERSTLQDFGGKAGLSTITDEFVGNLLADARISKFFEKADRSHLSAMLADQFCAILEGPCQYKGHDMADTHQGMNISEANFNALVEDLQLAMTKHGVPFAAQNKLLAKLAPMHRVIIRD